VQKSVLGLFLLLSVYPPLASPVPASPANLEARRKQLSTLLAEEWEYELRESPEKATVIGDYRYNDRWRDFSLAHVPQRRADLESWLSRFDAIDATDFPEQEKLSKLLMVRDLKMRIEGIDLKSFEMSIDQFNGWHLWIAQGVSFLPFNTTKQYEDYLTRLHGIPVVIDQIIGVLRQGEKDRLMPPRYLLEKTVEQCKSIAAPAGKGSPFGQPLAHFPDAVSVVDRTRLDDAIVVAIDSDVRPAYVKLANFLATEYAPKGRTDIGVWALPNGDALYSFYIREQTTTSIDNENLVSKSLRRFFAQFLGVFTRSWLPLTDSERITGKPEVGWAPASWVKPTDIPSAFRGSRLKNGPGRRC